MILKVLQVHFILGFIFPGLIILSAQGQSSTGLGEKKPEVSESFYSRLKALNKEVQYDGDDKIEHYFDHKGQLVHKRVTRNGQPYNGIFHKTDYYFSYDLGYTDGDLTEITTYWSGSRFSHREGTKEVFYNLKGEMIAEASYESFESDIPLNGTVVEVTFDTPKGQPYYIHTSYIDGEIVKEAIHFRNEGPKHISKTETFFKGGKVNRKKRYYSSGELQSDILYNSIITATYYNKNGKVLGVATKKDGISKGTEVQFFPDSDLIETIITYDEFGKVEKKLRYVQYYNENNIPYTELETSLQAHGTSEFYGYGGKLLARAEYNETGPVSGSIVKYTGLDRGQYMVVPYKDGEVEGVVKTYERIGYHPDSIEFSEEELIKNRKFEPDSVRLVKEVYYKNGKRNGLSKQYNSNGTVASVCNYENDVLHGEVNSYDSEGNLEEVVVYHQGEIYEGTIVSTFRNKQIEYRLEKGELVCFNVKAEGRLVETTTHINGHYKTIVCNENGYKEVTLLTDENKSGSIVFHNRKVTGKNMIKRGEPVSGTFYMTDTLGLHQSEDGISKLMKFTLQPNFWELTAYNGEGKQIFQKSGTTPSTATTYYFDYRYLNRLSIFHAYTDSYELSKALPSK